ncbi:hypothetical protein [Streptomyces griseomycini]|uniref:Uncharacterized protein n=1 Tax=Streptomyces griseomycini TaxID=66895 RepID=A0A7W7PWQ2_9ACTN|nr:hypothetical protein [Streptomyces griseomycini]MBB4902621.1 hypothetical protein [Streptomyces griseomycini]GGR54528.1 hypothetical protein GCM10015536_69910 [Streptomyces griseomycini]
MLRRKADKTAKRLERALDGGPIPHDADARHALMAAGALAPGHVRSPERIKQTEDVMMAAFMRTLNPLESRDDAGTGDGLEETELHREVVELPDGAEIIISDLEEITPELLQESAGLVAEILARRAKDHQS